MPFGSYSLLVSKYFLGTGLLGARSLGGHKSSSYEAIFDISTDSESLGHSLKYGFYDFLS